MTLVRELQTRHGWMFFELPARRDRRSSIFRRTANGKSHEIIPARAVKVAFPADSALAMELDMVAFPADSAIAVDAAQPGRKKRRK